jgi:hypothetical protein
MAKRFQLEYRRTPEKHEAVKPLSGTLGIRNLDVVLQMHEQAG